MDKSGRCGQVLLNVRQDLYMRLLVVVDRLSFFRGKYNSENAWTGF